MTALAFALALALATTQPDPAPSLSWAGGRVYTSPHLHVGVRPAFYFDNEGERRHPIEIGVGATVQVTTRW